VREKCKQNTIIESRDLIQEFYEEKLKKLLQKSTYLDKEEAKRLKAIFLNSDAIFDSGFIEFLSSLTKFKNDHNKNNPHKNRIFVYEYLHENTGSQPNLKAFKQYLHNNYKLSTHFDGIDLAFGELQIN
jgi:hypothetical protein